MFRNKKTPPKFGRGEKIDNEEMVTVFSAGLPFADNWFYAGQTCAEERIDVRRRAVPCAIAVQVQVPRAVDEHADLARS
jgi:hypothetical protein